MSLRRAVSLLVTCALLPGSASAGGFLFYEVGTSEMGLASAGGAARANSPSTLLNNPAGMVCLEGTQVQVGTSLVYGHLQFAPDSQTDARLGTNDGGNAVGVLPSFGAFASFEPEKDVRLGVGVFTNFGAPQSWDPAWVGRHYTTKTTLLGLSIMPGFAWRVTEGLSLGGSVNVMSGHLKQVVAIQNLEPQSGDGSLEVSSNTWGVGGNVGILYALSPATRFGFTYTSPVKLNFSATPAFANLGPGISRAIASAGLDMTRIDLGMKVPQTVMLGFFEALGERWTLVGDVGWQGPVALRSGRGRDLSERPAQPHHSARLQRHLARRARRRGAALRALGAELRRRVRLVDDRRREPQPPVRPRQPAPPRRRCQGGDRSALGPGLRLGAPPGRQSED